MEVTIPVGVPVFVMVGGQVPWQSCFIPTAGYAHTASSCWAAAAAPWDCGEHTWNARRYGSQRSRGQSYPSSCHHQSAGPHGFPKGRAMPQQEEPRKHVGVALTSLPAGICTESCLEASFEQAGLENAVLGFEVRVGEASILLGCEGDAQRCIKHFHGLKWSKNEQAVCAKYSSEAGRILEEKMKRETGTDQIEKEEKSVESEAPEGDSASRSDAPSASQRIAAPQGQICSIPPVDQNFWTLPSVSKNQKRWADCLSDDEEEEFDSCDVSTTSPGNFDIASGMDDFEEE